jgi:hypothetical protein
MSTLINSICSMEVLAWYEDDSTVLVRFIGKVAPESGDILLKVGTNLRWKVLGFAFVSVSLINDGMDMFSIEAIGHRDHPRVGDILKVE